MRKATTLVALVVTSVAVTGCSKSVVVVDTKPISQKQYCIDNGWKYVASTKTCKMELK
jgi:hypothetical protein